MRKTFKWPSPAAGHCLHCIHINMIQVGSFFPVYLDIDEMFIHDRGRCLIFKTFPFHYMTPMTGRITNAYQNGFVFFFCFLQCFFAPGIPIHRIMCMLKQVRTCFVDEFIGVFDALCIIVSRSSDDY